MFTTTTTTTTATTTTTTATTTTTTTATTTTIATTATTGTTVTTTTTTTATTTTATTTTAIVLSLGGSRPYTSTDKTSNNKYTQTKQYKTHGAINTKHSKYNVIIKNHADGWCNYRMYSGIGMC